VSVPTTWVAPTAVERLDILQGAHRVAIVGMSSKPTRASYFVATYLRAESAYELFFVNPAETEILGEPCYPSLAAVPIVPDIVDVFRRVADLPSVADGAIAVGAAVLWFQLGLRDDETASRATEAGLRVVQDRCLKIEHARFKGGLHLAGFDTGVISARRRRTL
jgi:uncharacterized protein